MNLGQLIGELIYPDVAKANPDRPRGPSAKPPLGTVTHSSDLLQVVVPPAQPAAAAAAPAPVVVPAVLVEKAPLRLGTTGKILRILAKHGELTSVGINERLGGPFINVAALLSDPRTRGDVEIVDKDHRPFLYRITDKGRARL